MISFLTGVLIPLITKAAQGLIDGKIKTSEIKATANAQIATANVNNAVELAKYQAQTTVALADVEKTAILNRPKTSSTNAVIRIAMDVIRLLFGIGAIGVFVMASLHYFYPAHFGNVLAYSEFSDAFFIILGFFFGERCVKKAWGN